MELFGRKNTLHYSSARENMIARLNIRHGDAVAATAERSLFVEFEGLRYAINARHGEPRCIDRFHFADYIIFAESSVHEAASWSESGAFARFAAGFVSAFTAGLKTSRRNSGNQRSGCNGSGVAGLLGANDHFVADFEIRDLCRLAVLAKLGGAADLDGSFVAVGASDFDGV